MKVGVTVDSGVAGNVVLEGIFSRVKLERKAAPTKCVAANGAQVRDVGEKTSAFKTNEGIHRCKNIQRKRGQASHLDAGSRSSWKHCGAE